MTLCLAQSARLLPSATQNSLLLPRLQRTPLQLPAIPRRVLFRCCANGGVEAQPGGDNALNPFGGTTKSSDALKGEDLSPIVKESRWSARAESRIETAIFDFRFLTLMAIGGSLGGSLLCFAKGCGFVYDSYVAFIQRYLTGVHTGRVILRLVEAVEIYLVGTVLLIFAMGLFGLFISNDETLGGTTDRALKNTTFFGMFALSTRPAWMQITTLDTLKSKLGHCIVMILIVKLFEKSKTVWIATSTDLLMYSFCIFFASGTLYVLQKMHVSD